VRCRLAPCGSSALTSWRRVFFVFGFAVLFPTYVYRSIIMPLSVRLAAQGCYACYSL